MTIYDTMKSSDGPSLRTVFKTILLSLCACSAIASDKIVVADPAHSDPSQVGLYAGGAPNLQNRRSRANANASAERAAVAAAIADDWREVNGTVYNVAVKQRAESFEFPLQFPEVEVKSSSRLLPDWELVNGKVVSTNGPLVIESLRRVRGSEGGWESVKKTVADGKSEYFKPGQILAYYCFKQGNGLYEYGKRLTAKEALERISKKETRPITAEKGKSASRD
ncbi:MAG TPA: hypothetical protein VGR78_16975 [Verrucomicrobiae bacterium]|jgi:hypothetical protein|nr:hypothetical protein [Verrucomicrobiae bacterium]